MDLPANIKIHNPRSKTRHQFQQELNRIINEFHNAPVRLAFVAGLDVLEQGFSDMEDRAIFVNNIVRACCAAKYKDKDKAKAN